MKYELFVEIGADGRAMAHVPQLPGCTARGRSREEALEAVPGAISAYLSWLRDHDEDVRVGAIEIETVGEVIGTGPFDPGDAAALFPPDQETLAPGEMARLFRLMEYSRDDLTTLIHGVPADVLTRPYTAGWSVQKILYHIGRAEVWYVSRIAHSWDFTGHKEYGAIGDVTEWLKRTREAAVKRLRDLSAEERSDIFYPSHYTEHPEEAWTARKVFRRFLEHEREHRTQIEAVLEAGWSRARPRGKTSGQGGGSQRKGHTGEGRMGERGGRREEAGSGAPRRA